VRLCAGSLSQHRKLNLTFHKTLLLIIEILLQFLSVFVLSYRLCGLVVRVLGYRSEGPGSIPGTTRKENNGSGTGSTQLREYN
jgi:hypothetical protein